LMLSLDPSLTRSQVVSYLRASARPFPAGTSCTLPTLAGKCGAGLLDAHAAMTVIAPNIAVASNHLVVPPHSWVPLDATVTAPVGRTIVSTSWDALPGNPEILTIANAGTPNAGFHAPQTGTFGFIISVLDSSGKTASEIVTVRVNTPPVIAAVDSQRGQAGAPIDFRLH